MNQRNIVDGRFNFESAFATVLARARVRPRQWSIRYETRERQDSGYEMNLTHLERGREDTQYRQTGSGVCDDLRHIFRVLQRTDVEHFFRHINRVAGFETLTQQPT